MTESLKKTKPRTLFETFFFLKSCVHISNQNKKITGLRNNEDGNGTFLLTLHRAIKVTTYGLRVFYFNGKDKMFFWKTVLFPAQALRYLSYLKVVPHFA